MIALVTRVWRGRPVFPGRPSGGAARSEPPSRMRARAEIRTELRGASGGRLRTQLTGMRGQAPLTLHAGFAKEPEPWAEHADDVARVCLAAGAAGPLGGDRLRLDVNVGPGSTLVLSEASATLLLPGWDGALSRTDYRIRVEAAATLILLPEPVIAAGRCHHLSDIRVELAPDARLVLREELVLGRYGEEPGRVSQRIRVTRSGYPLHSQELEIGTEAATSPVVLGGHRAVGSLLLVDPALTTRGLQATTLPGHTRLLPLKTDAVVLSALADDHPALRRQFAAGLAKLGSPWDPTGPADPTN